MTIPLVLASGSAVRTQMLRKAGVPHDVRVARVDEEMIRAALEAEGASPRDISDALAEAKARKVSGAVPGSLVLGCDQVLDAEGTILSKPDSPEAALEQLRGLRGKRHMLHSAAVIYEGGEPVWRHIGTVRMHMRDASDTYLQDYVHRNWPDIGASVGGYKIEEEGIRLFQRIDGDYFAVLGMPLVEILGYLMVRGVVPQ